MSVTFHLATMGDDGIIRPACSGHFGTCADCADGIGYGVCDHTDAATMACPTCSLDVNMSNVNAASALDRLGIDFDYCGSLDGADLLGRAMVGNVGRDDSGMPAVVVGNVVHCGLPADYFADRLGQLANLASAATARGLLVAWS